MRTLVTVMMMVAGSSAQAADGVRVWNSDPNKVEMPKLTPWEEQVAGCWNFTAEMAASPGVDLDATLDAGGNVIAVAEVRPGTTSADIEVADSAVRAIWKCSPYKDQGAGIIRFRMDPRSMF